MIWCLVVGGRLTRGVALLRVYAGAAAPGATCLCCYASCRMGGRACFRGRGRRPSRPWSSSQGGMVCLRDGPVVVAVVALRTKVLH